MSVACDCGTDGDWWYHGPHDFQILNTKYSRKCFSCGDRIAVGADCGRFYRYRAPRDEPPYIEDRIYGDEVPLTTWYLCEECAGVYFSIDALGYCVMIGDGMTMKQNAHMIGNPEYWE